MIKYETTTPVEGPYKEHALSALEKVAKMHEEARAKMTESEKLFDERMFEYYFEDGEKVTLNSDFVKLNDAYSPYSKYLGKVAVVESYHVDMHAFGRGSSYVAVCDFGDNTKVNISTVFLVKYKE